MIFVFLTFIFSTLSFSESHVVTISQEVTFKPGDVIKLKDSPFFVSISLNKGTECAVPGRNCGAGYIPPHLTLSKTCSENKKCLYFIIADIKGIDGGKLSIETEETCLKKNYEMCFNDYSGTLQSDEGCSSLKTSMGQYFCLNRFSSSNRPENKDLCDKLPDSIYALKWNCYYEFAIRYKDPSYCEKYSQKELSGKDRCYLKMAELFKDKTLCSKISASKEHTYKEQCLEIK